MSHIVTIRSFVMINFESIFYIHYRLKTSIVTEMGFTNSCSSVLKLRTTLHHIRKNTPEKKALGIFTPR